MREEPVRILYVINALELGGTEGQLVELLNGMDKRKVLPYLCCLRAFAGKPSYETDCPKITLNVGRLKSFQSLVALIRLIRYMKKERIHIVQTFFIKGTLFGVVAGRLARHVSVIIVSKRDLGFMITTSMRKRLGFVYRFADRFLANSRSVETYLVEREGVDRSRIDVMYNGIDVEVLEEKARSITAEAARSSVQIPQNALVVGICSNLNRPVKRVDLFLTAVAHVLKAQKDVYALIIGDGTLKEDLMEQASRLGIAEKTRFAGSRSNPLPFIRLFSVGVISSDSEGLSNAIMEYMCCGVPVVATDVGGNPELITDGVTGTLVARGNAEEMATAIQKFLTQPDFRQSVGMAARKSMRERFSKETMLRAHESYYADVLCENR